jgi:hypothetical protein
MDQSSNRRSYTFNVLLYNVAASVIVIVGVFSFAYVGERMSHGSSMMTSAIEAPETSPR